MGIGARFAMTFPIRLRSIDRSAALFAVLLLCAIGGVSSLLYFETDDNQPLLTLRRRPKDPQPNYPARRETGPTTQEKEMRGKEDRTPPSSAQNPAA